VEKALVTRLKPSMIRLNERVGTLGARQFIKGPKGQIAIGARLRPDASCFSRPSMPITSAKAAKSPTSVSRESSKPQHSGLWPHYYDSIDYSAISVKRLSATGYNRSLL
jgi:hypothetical protein